MCNDRGIATLMAEIARRIGIGLLALVMAVVVLASCAPGAAPESEGQAAEEAELFPEFPWPPPPASAREELPGHLFNVVGVDISLGDVSNRITVALDENGYFESSYFAVPDGFAVVTRLEQIEPDGTPKEEPERWSLDVAPLRPFSLAEYIRRLFFGVPGYYRVIVFVVTPHPFSQSGPRVTPEQLDFWLTTGFNRLPDEVASLAYTDDFAATALIYEFARPTENDEMRVNYPGALPGRVHLERSGIWRELLL